MKNCLYFLVLPPTIIALTLSPPIWNIEIILITEKSWSSRCSTQRFLERKKSINVMLLLLKYFMKFWKKDVISYRYMSVVIGSTDWRSFCCLLENEIFEVLPAVLVKFQVLNYDVVSMGKWFLVFRRIILLLPSMSRRTACLCKMKVFTTFRTVENCLPTAQRASPAGVMFTAVCWAEKLKVISATWIH
jgi:hypothetical protein